MANELKLVDDTIQCLLKPLGFKKKKLLWWRERGEITQVVGLEKMTYGAPHYNFIYGLIIDRFKFQHIPNIAFNGLNIDWNIGRAIGIMEEKKRLFSALRMDNPMPAIDRENAIKELVTKYVLPTFESTDTIDKLRTVLMDKKNILSRVDMITFTVDQL